MDRPEPSALTASTWQLPFPVLSDPDLNAHSAWNVTDQTGWLDRAAIRALMGAQLEDWSGRSDGAIAIAASFYVDAEGTVRWAHADLALKERPSPAQILEAIDALE